MLSIHPDLATQEAPRATIEQALKSAIGRTFGLALFGFVGLLWVSVASWSVSDPSLTHATSGETRNLLGAFGAIVSDLLLQAVGFATLVVLVVPMFWALELTFRERVQRLKSKLILYPLSVLVLAGGLSALPVAGRWPLHHGYGGMLGDGIYAAAASLLAAMSGESGGALAGLALFAAGFAILSRAVGISLDDLASFRSRIAGTDAAHAVSPPSLPPIQGMVPPREDLARGVGLAIGVARHTAHRGHSILKTGARGLQDGLMHGFAGAQDRWSRAAQGLAAHAERAAHAAQTHPHAAGHQPASGHGRAAAAPTNPMAVGYPMHGAHAHGARPPYHPPYSPAAMPPPMPLRGPAAAMARGMQPVADGYDGAGTADFDLATDATSLAIARRFAPAGSGPIVVGDDVATGVQPSPAPPPAPPAYEGRSARIPEFAPSREPAAVSVPTPAAAPVAATASQRSAPEADSSHKRNALFGGLKFRRQAEPSFRLPAAQLLRKPPPAKAGPELTQTVLRGNARLLEDVLKDFGIKGEVKDIRPGPVVTLFELEPARGTKSSRVIGLADDIARSMSASAVRVAVVPGRNAIGIELPNVRREPVLLRELLESEAFRSSDAVLPLALGKGIGGEPIVADLARMPHLLVAGTTGSGKSVGVNAMILSLLYRLTPEECRFLMIDPKMLELSVYNGIPHLLAPVVTDPAKAVGALNWVVGEMEERYKRMAKLSVRNIDVYNNRVRNAKKRGEMIARTVQTGFDKHSGEAIYEQETLTAETMPYIVVVIDEFADLMLVAGKDVEAAVQRLAQMARAAGIHIIMATQRPSVDVITGTIKANFPTRISFKVTSKIDSRTILNEQGAEQLLGQGDMLHAAGSGQTARVHGAFVSDEEVEAVAGHLRSQGAPDYLAAVTAPTEVTGGEESSGGGSEEDLYDRAVAIVLRDRKASTSYVQRRLSIGYNRAADLMERMEREGVVSAASNVGRREILASPAGDSGESSSGSRSAA